MCLNVIYSEHRERINIHENKKIEDHPNSPYAQDSQTKEEELVRIELEKSQKEAQAKKEE